ncbi:MAG: UDP-N-acetylglucosamine 1-carboxyvinyltransferase [Firmicutes bacterium]|jgi:UDP-N-acetylglucosamine 1-carboxyvinyltransferase|nr:UDP-N-acetylglucosamine 1-carboxyvinyltransferase [Bacillota bacterium]
MDVLVIEGGKPLSGSVRISGAKNAVLKLMAASLLTAEECVIRNVPRIKDVENMVNVLLGLGAQVIHDGDVISIRAGEDLSWEAPEDNAREMRASIQIMGPLLARFGRVRIAHPGGCAIGTRPVDLHVNSLRKMGADLRDEFGFITGSCTQLTGQDIYLDIPSVGATENIMMAATLAKGTTVIRNAAREPEVVEVQNFLNRMGAHVRGAGTDTIRIHGVDQLGGADHTVIPDRIEVGTYMVAAAMTRGELVLSPVIPDHLDMVMAKLRQAGVEIDVRGDHLRVRGPRVLRPLDIRTGPHPGFPTDMQPQFMAMLCLAHGTSVIVENVYSSRFQHVEELMPMGAQITVDGRLAVVRGPCRLTGTRVSATDLRAGAALVLAGLAAEGITELERVHHVDRGYEDLEIKLRGVGAAIIRKSVVSAEALV